MLSDKQVRALRSTGKDVMRADGGGLYIRVSVHGTKTFMFRTRAGGKARYLTLGEYPRLTLLDARVRVSELQGKAMGDLTLSYAVEKYLESCSYQHPDQVKNRLTRDILPVLGSRRLSVISASDISSALQKIVDRGSPVSANRTLADVRHVFEYAHGKGWVHTNPSERITRKVVGGKEKPRETVLTDDEIKDLITCIRSKRWEIKTRVGLALCLLTGQRASECLGITGEVKGAWWTIPKERTKKDRDQKVYLVPLARWLTRHAEVCNHCTLSHALKRLGVRYTPHDLRRTMRTRMGDLGVMPHIAEKCLNHKLEGVLAVYDHADYLPEREVAWKLWYSYVRRLASET